MSRFPILSVFFVCAALSWTTVSVAQDFRIETEIYVGDADQPVVENLTLFAGEVVYDFLLSEPEEITVFDFRRGRFILLDPERRMQTRLATSEIEKFTLALQTRQADGLLAFLLKPEFEVTLNDENGWLTLDSDMLTYRVKGDAPKFAGAVNRYRLFADWCARLNAPRAGNLPPFARMELNRELAERGWLPVEVHRTLRKEGGGSRSEQLVRSQQSAIWRLSSRDRERIDQIKRYLASFDTVDLDQFRRIASTP